MLVDERVEEEANDVVDGHTILLCKVNNPLKVGHCGPAQHLICKVADALVGVAVTVVVVVPLRTARRRHLQVPVPLLRKRVRQREPPLRAADHLRIGQQARVDRGLGCPMIQVPSDDDELCLPVTVLLVPERFDVILECFRPQLARDCVPPGRTWIQTELRARERGVSLLTVARGDPCDALEPEQVGERAWTRAAAKGGMQALRVERTLGAVDEGGDAILDGLGQVLVFPRFGQPVGMRLGSPQREARLVEQHRRLEAAVHGAEDFRPGVDLLDEPLDSGHLDLAEEIHLIERDHVGELELLTQQLRNRAHVAGTRLPAALRERVHGGQLLEDRG